MTQKKPEHLTDNKPTLEAKIETKREFIDPDEPSLPPMKDNESVPEGWKVRPDKNTKQEHLTDKSKPTIEAKIERLDPGDYSLPPVKGDESVPKGWKIRLDKNKKQEHLTDRCKPTLEAKIKIKREVMDQGGSSLPPAKGDKSVPKGW